MKKDKYNLGFTPILIFIITSVIMIITGLSFFAIPHSSNLNAIEPFNRKGGFMFGEKISYLFRKPKVGDAIIFMPKAGETSPGIADYIGIITKINEEKEIRTYQVMSIPGKPWEITADKIKERIYYPQVTKKHLDQALSQITSKPTQNAKTTSDETANHVPDGDPTNWETYINTKLGISFSHPNLDDKCCNVSGPVSGKAERIIILADKSTTLYGTDKPFDGFGLYVVSLDGKTFSIYLEEQKKSLLENFKMMITDPSLNHPTPNTNEESVVIGGSQGVILKGYAWWADMVYLPFPKDKRVLVIAKGEESPGSFDATFNQILSTFRFTE